MFSSNRVETVGTIKDFISMQDTRMIGKELTKELPQVQVVKPHVVEKMDFLVGEVIEEVSKTKSHRKRAAIKKKLMAAYVGALAFAMTATPSFATTSLAYAPDPSVLPTEINETLVTIQFICLSIAGGVAAICLMMAGALKMFGMESKAKTWTQEILKGFAQILVAPVVIWGIAAIVRLFLKPLPGYIPF